MRALVISGGGCKGAWAGGVAEHLIKERGIDYDIFVGSSTGSLLIPHLAIGRIDKIKGMYTNVCQDDIYTVNPFILKPDGEGGMKASINHKNIIKMFLKKHKTFGDTTALRNTIENTLSKDDFREVQRSGKKVIVTVCNITRTTVEYRYAIDCLHSDFLDWMWASSCFVPFMSLVVKNGNEYADGGFGNFIPIEEAINIGATEIDVIVLNPRRQTTREVKTYNVFDVLLKSFLFMQKQIAYDDVLIGHLESIYNKDVKVNFIFTPTELTEHAFYFEPKQMKGWWQEGLEYAREYYSDIKFKN